MLGTWEPKNFRGSLTASHRNKRQSPTPIWPLQHQAQCIGFLENCRGWLAWYTSESWSGPCWEGGTLTKARGVEIVRKGQTVSFTLTLLPKTAKGQSRLAQGQRCSGMSICCTRFSSCPAWRGNH